MLQIRCYECSKVVPLEEVKDVFTILMVYSEGIVAKMYDFFESKRKTPKNINKECFSHYNSQVKGKVYNLCQDCYMEGMKYVLNNNIISSSQPVFNSNTSLVRSVAFQKEDLIEKQYKTPGKTFLIKTSKNAHELLQQYLNSHAFFYHAMILLALTNMQPISHEKYIKQMLKTHPAKTNIPSVMARNSSSIANYGVDFCLNFPVKLEQEDTDKWDAVEQAKPLFQSWLTDFGISKEVAEKIVQEFEGNGWSYY